MTDSELDLQVPTAYSSLDRFQIEAVIGEGSLSCVYRAYDRLHKRKVALKVPHPHLRAVLARNEALLAQRVSHPNVLRIFDLHANGISMELLEGGSLADIISSGEKLEISRALRLVTDVAAGLAEAHRCGVIHADLKPANILLDKNGNAKISDFGLSSSASVVWADHELRGTTAYMAPELRNGGIPDERSDCYALGLIMSHLLLGSVETDRIHIVRRTRKLKLRELPRPVCRVLRASLREDARRRPTATEIHDVLAKASRSKLSFGPPYEPSKRRIFLAMSVLVTLFGAFAPFFGYQRFRAYDPLVLLPLQTDECFESAVFAESVKDRLISARSQTRPIWFPFNHPKDPVTAIAGRPVDTLSGRVRFEGGHVVYNIELRSRGRVTRFERRSTPANAVADLEKLVQKVLGTEIAPNNWEQLPYYQALATIKRYSNSERLLLRAIANLEPSARLRTSPKFIGVQVRLYLALFALTHNSKWQTRAFNSLAGQIDVSADPDLAIAASLAYLSQENDNEAARIIEEALRRSPHQPDLLATAAKLDLRRGAIMEALKRLREVATVNPLDADIFTNLGAAYLGIPDPKNAVKELQRAYELNPSPRALSNLGAAYLYSGNFGAAEPILERAVDMDPTGGATCNLGQALWGLGRRDLALSVLEHASRRDATELTSGCLAHVYRWAGQSELAKQEFLTAIRLARNTLNQSNDPVLRGRLATYEAGIGSRQALIDIRRARGLRLADLDLLIKNAIVLQMLGDKQAATSLVDEIVRRGGREIIENHPDLSMLSSPQH